jgi:putative PEP-CTERM system TPR-repeat lipoprotein
MNATWPLTAKAALARQLHTHHLRKVAVGLVLALSLVGCSRNDPASLLASAKQYIAKGDYNASIIQLKNVLQKDPKNAQARYLLGLSMLKNGDPGAAEIELKKAVESGLHSDEVKVALARAQLDKGDAKKVITDFGSATLSSPNLQAELRGIVGMAELARGRKDDARKTFTEALALDASDATANLGMARIEASEKDFKQAMARVDGVLGSSPTDLDALMLKGTLLEAQGQSEAAEKAYRDAVQAAPHQVPPRLSLVALLVNSRLLDKASTEVDALEKIAPKDPRTYYAKALLLVEQRKFAAAKEAILHVLKVAPTHIPSLLLAGTAAMETGAFPEAESYLRKAAYEAPDAIAPKRLLAMTYLRMGKTDLALNQVKELLTKTDKDPNILTLAGEIYLANGDIAHAVQYYDEANSAAPGNPAIETRLAEARFAAGDRERAIKELEAISASHPDRFQADVALVSTYLAQRQPDKALDAVKTLEKKQPDNPLTYNLRGLALILKRDFPAARASFERALQLQANYMPAVINLANLDLRDKNTDAAKQRYEAVLKTEPYNEQALFRLAVLQRITGAKQEDVEKLLKQAVTGNPTSARARLVLINYHLANRDFKGALTAAQDAQAALPSSPAIMEALGVAQLAAGETQAAISTFAQLSDLLPNSPEPLVRQAQAYLAAKRPDDAIRALRQALSLNPDLATAERDIAAIYVATGRIDDALREAKEVQTKKPDKPFGYALEGEIYAAQKKWGAAAGVYENAVKRFQLPLLIARAHALMEAAGQGPKAEAMVRAWIKDHPDDTVVLAYLSQRDLAAKRYSDAAKYLHTALERQPNNPAFLNNLAWAMHELKQPNALQYAERAHDLAPENAAIMDTLGSILVDTGDTPRGLELLGRASELAPNAYDIRLHFAKALIKAGRKDAARKELEVLAKLDNRLPVQREAAALLSGL